MESRDPLHEQGPGHASGRRSWRPPTCPKELGTLLLDQSLLTLGFAEATIRTQSRMGQASSDQETPTCPSLAPAPPLPPRTGSRLPGERRASISFQHRRWQKHTFGVKALKSVWRHSKEADLRWAGSDPSFHKCSAQCPSPLDLREAMGGGG